jgi:hypothetical protein
LKSVLSTAKDQRVDMKLLESALTSLLDSQNTEPSVRGLELMFGVFDQSAKGKRAFGNTLLTLP